MYQINKTMTYEGPRMRIPNTEEVTPSSHRLRFPTLSPMIVTDSSNTPRWTCLSVYIRIIFGASPDRQTIDFPTKYHIHIKRFVMILEEVAETQSDGRPKVRA